MSPTDTDNRMKLVFLASTTQVHSRKWIRHFSNHPGYHVYVLTLDSAPIEGATVISLARTAFGKLGYILSVLKARRYIKKIAPDIVHAHYASGYGLLGALLGFHPFVLSVWGSDVYEFPRRSFLHKAIFRFNLSRADSICSTSRAMAQEIRKYTRKPIVLTPFGIDLEQFQPGAKANDIVIGTIKGLEQTYGIDHLIRVFALLTKSCSDLPMRLEIVGGGSLREELARLALELGVEQSVSFTGPVEHADVPHHLATFRVFVALSNRESFGVAVLEASACGVPVVVSDVDGLPEVVVDKVTGYLVNPKDHQKAADIIERILRDPEIGRRMGESGRQFVKEKYEWCTTASIMEAVYAGTAGK